VLGPAIEEAFCISSGISKNALGFVRIELDMERTFQAEESEA